MNGLKSPWFYARIFVGLIFAYAGLTKLMEPYENFRGIIANYAIIPYAFSGIIAQVLPWIEFMTGAFLILGYMPRWSSLIAAGLFFSFLIILGSTDALMVPGKDCGCFGERALIHLTTRQVFTLDCINFILCLKLYSLKRHPFSLDGLLGVKPSA